MEERKGFGTTFGFLMAAVGSAVGLGNIWGFPNKMGANGGFTFLVIYLILAALCGFIVMVGELALGRKTGRGVISTYKILTKRFKWLGWLGIIAPFLILSFYCALGGYCIKYVTVNLGSLFNAGFGTGGLGGAEVFGGLLTNQGESVIYGLIFVLITLIIVMCGVSNGIEKVCSVGMPALFILLVICIIRACTLGGSDFTVAVLQADGSTVQQVIHSSALDGLKYMFQPGYVTSTGYYEPAKALVDGAMVGAVAGVPVVKHVTEIPNFISILATAGGQMFFSLSLGMGIMITYGSYTGKEINLVRSTAMVCVFDTVVALLAGLAIFPSVAHFDPSLLGSSKGVALMFIILPQVFESMGSVGQVVSFAFFVMVDIAAITSVVSLIEVVTQFVIQKFHVHRKRAALVVACVCFVVSIPIGISLGHVAILEESSPALFGLDWLTFFDEVTNTVLMPVCALFSCIVVGWFITPKRAVAEIEAEGTHMAGWLKKVYAVMIRFVTPALILIVEIGGLQSEIAAGNTAVIVFAYALVALCVVAYFAFFRNRDTGTNADEKLSGDYPV